MTLGALKWPLLSIVFPRACLIGFTFCQPFLINRAITLAMEPVTEHTTNMGYGLIAAYVIVYVGIAVSLYLEFFANSEMILTGWIRLPWANINI